MADDARGQRTPAQAFELACWLDVAVRKPGNVSVHSAGHRMKAAQFVGSAQAAARALFDPTLRVGPRIEAAVRASFAAAGCNTNLGIVLLAAPLAAAAQQPAACTDASTLRAALQRVLDALDAEDAAAVFRAIAHANPGGLGAAPEADVRRAPAVGLIDAMRLAASRDHIAQQYASGFADVFDLGLPALAGGALAPCAPGAPPTRAAAAAVQRCFLTWLAHVPDSHIVRKHGSTVARRVQAEASEWLARARQGAALDDEPSFAAWDEGLKSMGINPGTSADLTVAVVLVESMLDGAAPGVPVQRGMHQTSTRRRENHGKD